MLFSVCSQVPGRTGSFTFLVITFAGYLSLLYGIQGISPGGESCPGVTHMITALTLSYLLL